MGSKREYKKACITDDNIRLKKCVKKYQVRTLLTSKKKLKNKNKGNNYESTLEFKAMPISIAFQNHFRL